MADKQNPNDPQYDWLYAGQSSSADDEATRAVPEGTEPTRMLDVGEPGHQGQVPSDQPPAAPPPASFGGTYAAPPTGQQQSRPSAPPAPPQERRQDGPRYATPSPSQTQPPKSPAGGRPTGPEKPGKRRRLWLRIVLIVLAVWLLFLIIVPIWSWSQITKVDAEPNGKRPPDSAGTTYLLVGSDSREGLSRKERRELGTGNAAGRRTDSILMLHVPDNDGPNLLLSIPRDSYVDIPGQGKNKINAAFALGGPKLLVRTVEQNTGVHIDNYVEIGFAGFVDVVDAVGGITVCPKESINDPKANHLKIKKGCQEVDGTTALGYARSRAFADGDVTRAEHQREVIAQVGKEAASWQTIVFPWRYWSVNQAAAKTLRIGDNVGPLDMVKFAWAMAHTGGKDAKKCVVPIASLGTNIGGQSMLIWNEQKANAVFESIQEDNTADIKCSARGQ